jgi:hypothetical protein
MLPKRRGTLARKAGGRSFGAGSRPCFDEFLREICGISGSVARARPLHYSGNDRSVNGMSGFNKLRLTHLAREFDTQPSSKLYILRGVGL